MENYCAFSKDHKCILWLDYEITRQELEECHTLCHGNWIEIEHKYKYIQELRHPSWMSTESLIRKNTK